MKRIIGIAVGALLVGGAVVATTQSGFASDHDDGEPTGATPKNRNLNLTDHFMFKSPATPTEMSIIMYTNPRSLPGKAYFLNPGARYEFHISTAASRVAQPTLADNFVFRFVAGEPDAAGVQAITTTVIKDGAELGTHTGASTSFANSKANNTITTNTGTVGGIDLKYFIGMRADSFAFDVSRFFQVRAFLADRFFGKGTKGNNAATLVNNCRGDQLFANVAGSTVCDVTKEAGNVADADCINLWNPTSCAPDFTKNLNVTAIVLNVPIAQLGGGTIFDSWSTISIAQ